MYARGLSPWIVLPLLGAACSAEPVETEARWLRSFGYSWNLFNHRLSLLHLHPRAGGAEVAVIGGASTTQHVYDEDGTCISETCTELPAFDASTVLVEAWSAAASDLDGVLLLEQTVRLVADAGGASASAAVALPAPVPDGATAVAFLGGFTVDTGLGLPAEAAARSCYDPRHGWHPRRMAIQVDEARVDDVEAAATVRATFVAGPSGEDRRTCTDAVVADAQVAVEVDVVWVIAEGDVEAHTTASGADWALGESQFNPDPQPVPADGVTALERAFPDGAMGWTGFDLRFNERGPAAEEGLGAYLRSVGFVVEADDSAFWGHATSYSPITQLEGFGYDLEATLVEIDVDLGAARLAAGSAELPAALDAGFEPVFTTLPWEEGPGGGIPLPEE